ncbi:anthrone oxygenase family protein [Streptomyces sp. B6B3]|uniref:anthrone oxygenase family protein n=1 Tax=Streptomyces sp. B6B3 TaxID=3153570 RepID=UPI00325E8AA8
MTNLTALTATLTLLLTGLMAGVFFAFSVSVMLGLDAVDPGRAVAAMQSINDRIQNPVFLVAFVGVPVAAGATGGLLLALGHRGAGVAFLLAAGVYVFGAFLPTMVVNVPMNDTLNAAGTPDSPEHAARLWADFSPRWTAWNTARAGFSSLSLLLVGLGLYLWGRDR